MTINVKAGSVTLQVRLVNGIWRCSYRDADNVRRQINSADKAVAVEKVRAVAESLASRSRKMEVSWEEWEEFQAWKASKKSDARGAPLKVVLERFLETEERKSRRSERTFLETKKFISDAVDHFGPDRLMGAVSAKELTGYVHAPRLDGEPAAPRTKLNRRRYLVHFWLFAVDAELLPEGRTNAERIPAVEVVPTPKDILSPEEMRVAIDNVRDPWLPFLLLAGFAGIRHQELRPDAQSHKRPLQWEDVHLDEGIIIVSAQTSKGRRGRRRIIHMQPNLIAMIAALSPPATGAVCPHRPFTESESMRLAGVLGKDRWGQNPLRHSYGTYRMAICRDAPRVSEEMGNSVADIQQSYDAVATESQGKAWWKIRLLKRCSNWRFSESEPS